MAMTQDHEKQAQAGLNTAHSSDGSREMVEDLRGVKVGYGEERDIDARRAVHSDDNPHVYPKVSG